MVGTIGNIYGGQIIVVAWLLVRLEEQALMELRQSFMILMHVVRTTTSNVDTTFLKHIAKGASMVAFVVVLHLLTTTGGFIGV